MDSLFKRLLIMCVVSFSAHGYTLVTLLKKQKVLYLRPKNRLFLLMLSELILYHYLVHLSVDCAAIQIKLWTTLLAAAHYLLSRNTSRGMTRFSAELIHWQLSKIAGFSVCSDWWCHVPDRVSENEHFKLLWDFILITNRSLRHTVIDLI